MLRCIWMVAKNTKDAIHRVLVIPILKDSNLFAGVEQKIVTVATYVSWYHKRKCINDRQIPLDSIANLMYYNIRC